MGTGRRLLILTLAPLFSLLLFLLAFNFGLAKTLGSADSVKKILADSGLYSSIVPSLLKQNGQIDTAVGNLAATDPLVAQAAAKALPTGDIQKTTEAAVDNIYGWLNGTTQQPTFNINLAGSQGEFANNLAAEVQQKLSSLPTCTTPFTAADFDAVSATCLPPGMSPEAAAGQLRTELGSSSDFLNQANISAGDIKGNEPGKSVFQDQLKNAPSLYQQMKSSPLILGLAALLIGAALVFLRPTVASGLRHLGATLLSVGIAMMIFAWVFNYVVNNKITPNIRIENKAMQQNLQKAITDLSQQIDKNYWIFGGVYSALGAVALAAPLYLKPRAATATPAATAAAPPAKSPASAKRK